jgi:hypothetical protein
MKKHIYFFASTIVITLVSIFTACKDESKSAAPVISYGDITGLGVKSTEGDTIKFTLNSGVKKGTVTFDYSIVADGNIKSVYLMRNNISTRIATADGEGSYSAKVQDTLSPNLYTYRTEVKDLEGNITSQTIYIRIIGVPIIRKAIYDPATFSGTYPDNMKVVTIGTTKFLRVVFDGWENKFWFPMADTFNIDKTGWNRWKCKVKYVLGQSSVNNGCVLSTIDNYIRVNDDITPGAEWSEIMQWSGLYDEPAVPHFPGVNGSLQAINGSLLDGNMNTINYLNFYAVQNLPDWGPVTGDTLWISRIDSYDPLDGK